MRLEPHRTVTLDVHQIPGRQFRVSDRARYARFAYAPELFTVPIRKPGQTLGQLCGPEMAVRVEALNQCSQRAQALTHEGNVSAGTQVDLGRVSRIEAGDDHRAPLRRAAPIIWQHAARIAARHIFVRKLKLSS